MFLSATAQMFEHDPAVGPSTARHALLETQRAQPLALRGAYGIRHFSPALA